MISTDSRRLLWRLHALAAWLALPFLLIATFSGLIYLPTPQIEAWQTRHLRSAVLDPASPSLPLDALVAKAQAAAPSGWRLQHLSPPVEAGQALQLQFARPAHSAHHGHQGHQGHQTDSAAAEPVELFVDPASGALLGERRESARYGSWARRLHSRLLGGEGLRWLIEWAATCLLVMLASGLLLAWPVGKRGGEVPIGRSRWLAWHRMIGLLLASLSLLIVLTGLTWSRGAGAQVRAARDWAQQGAPRAPAGLRSSGEGAPLDWAAAAARAAALAPGQRLQIAAPLGPDGVWRVQSSERRKPWQRADIAFDARSGALLWRSGWAELPIFAKATALGIPFHRGEFGLWNQALLLAFGGGLLASAISGAVMAGRRWRRGQALLPAVRPGAGRGWRWRWPALGAALLLCRLIPLLAVFLSIFLLLEWRSLRAPAA